MPTLGEVQKVRNVVGLTEYLRRVKDGMDERNLFEIGINVPYGAFAAAVERSQEDWGKEGLILARSSEVSFTHEEVDPDDLEACERAVEMVADFVSRRAGDRLGIVAGQRDNGRFHVHFALANVDPTTGAAMRGLDASWRDMVKTLAETMRDHGMQHSDQRIRDREARILAGEDEKDAAGRTKTQLGQRRRGIEGPRDAMCRQVAEVLAKGTPASIEQLRERLAVHGLGVKERPGKQRTALTFGYLEDDGVTIKAGGSVRDKGVAAYVEDAAKPAPLPGGHGGRGSLVPEDVMILGSRLAMRRSLERIEEQEAEQRRAKNRAQQQAAAAQHSTPVKAPEATTKQREEQVGD